MQVIQKQEIMDNEKKQNILELLADGYSKQILHCILEKPKSALSISTEKNIPVSTIYRRLQTLHTAKLVSVSGCISSGGKKIFLYKSKIRSISLNCDLEGTIVELIQNP
ncbi:MAG: ArsR family transcriptional regulator [Nitrosopumilus sp.]|jgi:predicted transcriptional regulator